VADGTRGPGNGVTPDADVTPAAPSGRPSGRGRGDRPSGPRSAADMRSYAMDRLIESRLTPNKISMTGLVLNVAAAVLITQRLFFLAGVTFIIG